MYVCLYVCMHAVCIHINTNRSTVSTYVYIRVCTRLRPLARDADAGVSRRAPCCRCGARRALWTHIAPHCRDCPAQGSSGHTAGCHSGPFQSVSPLTGFLVKVTTPGRDHLSLGNSVSNRLSPLPCNGTSDMPTLKSAAVAP